LSGLVIYLAILYIYVYNIFGTINVSSVYYVVWSSLLEPRVDIYLIGTFIYQEFAYLLILAGLILLVSMIGSIVLTIDIRKKVVLDCNSSDLKSYSISKLPKSLTFSSLFGTVGVDSLGILPMFLFIILPVILSIAFFTLFERKILSAIQRRKGPNLVGLYGFLQPIADALKLLMKESIIPSLSNFMIFLFSPIIIFTISLANWGLIPLYENIIIADISINLFLLLAISSLGVYGIIMSG